MNDPAKDWTGFGHGFEEKFTRPECQGSVSHHRIRQFSLGELIILLRYEVDAFLDDDTDLSDAPGD
jgi:hypothetical protein